MRLNVYSLLLSSFLISSLSYASSWSIFLGADLGYSHYSPYKDSGTEAPRGGTDIGGRALLSCTNTDWVIDGGIGLQMISNQGTNSDLSINSDKTANGYGDLSLRLRLGETFQFGPEYEYWFGSDKGLNPTLPKSDTISDMSNTSSWIGLQALVELPSVRSIRIGARGLSGLGIPDRKVYILQAFIQVGFDLFSESISPNRTKKYERMNEDDLDHFHTPTNEPTPWSKKGVEPPAPKNYRDNYELDNNPEVLSTPSPPQS